MHTFGLCTILARGGGAVIWVLRINLGMKTNQCNANRYSVLIKCKHVWLSTYFLLFFFYLLKMNFVCFVKSTGIGHTIKKEFPGEKVGKSNFKRILNLVFSYLHWIFSWVCLGAGLLSCKNIRYVLNCTDSLRKTPNNS